MTDCTHQRDDFGHPLNINNCLVCLHLSQAMADRYMKLVLDGNHDPDRLHFWDKMDGDES